MQTLWALSNIATIGASENTFWSAQMRIKQIGDLKAARQK